MGIVSMMFFITACGGGKVEEQPVSDTEAQTFARELEKNMSKGNGAFMDDAMMWEVFYNRMKASINTKTDISRSDFRAVVSNMKMGEKTAENIGANGTFTLLRSYKEKGRQHLLFRLYSDEGINYLDFEITRVKGKTGIADIYVYLSGENISETVKELIAQANLAIKGKPGADDSRRAQKLTETQQMLRQERYQEVIDIIDNLPPAWKKVRVFMMRKLIAASRLSGEKFEETLAEYRAAFPNASNVDLMLLDGYITQKKYDLALRSIDNLDKQLGTDPLLDLQRGALYYQAGESDSAIIVLKRLTENMPDFEDGHSQLIQVLALSGQEAKAKELFLQAKESNLIKSKTVQMLEENYPEITK